MSVEYKEKRKSPRVEFTKGINYKVSPKSRFDLGLGEDISLGGMGLITFEDIPKEEEVLIEMQINDRIVHLSSIVVWSKKFEYSMRYRVGFKFDYSKGESLRKFVPDRKTIISEYVEDKLSG